MKCDDDIARHYRKRKIFFTRDYAQLGKRDKLHSLAQPFLTICQIMDHIKHDKHNAGSYKDKLRSSTVPISPISQQHMKAQGQQYYTNIAFR